jgi:hypothetical protein
MRKQEAHQQEPAERERRDAADTEHEERPVRHAVENGAIHRRAS